MKIHLRQIPPGETLHLEGTEPADQFDLEDAGAAALSPLEYSLDVGLSQGGLFATGRLALRVRLRCVACLEDFESGLVVDPFGVQKELDGRETVDLTPELREDIQLALPAYPRCDAEGRTTCPARFPQAPADAPPPSGKSAWQALDQLKTEN